MVRHSIGGFTWEGIDVLPYKEDGTTFKSVTRQVLFAGGHDLPVELRYFEVGPGGHSTLERHEHSHKVMIIRGCGRVLIGETVHSIEQNDLVQIPPMTWHQFRAGDEAPLGFLCLVSESRDRPQRPKPDDLEFVSTDPGVREFLRI